MECPSELAKDAAEENTQNFSLWIHLFKSVQVQSKVDGS